MNRAIERGIGAARRSLGADGAGNTSEHRTYPEGDTALVLYTLVKSGVSPDDPQVRKSLDWLRYRPVTTTYGGGVYVLALDAFKDRAFDGQIQAAAKWLEDHADPKSGRWAYPASSTDLSNTQYAVLGLWVAERHGFKAKVETWGALLTGVVQFQKPSGGFGYHADHDETGSMTVGALTALELALDRVPTEDDRFRDARRAAKSAMARGWAYLEGSFAVDGNPHGPHGREEKWTDYYLYGVERLAAIAKRDQIGGHDWYAEGARQLLATQRDDGSWGEPWDTCFALLFLRRATLTSMGGEGKPLTGGAVAAEGPKPVRPGRGVRWIRRWLVLGPAENPKDTLFDDPPFPVLKAAPTPGTTTARWKWETVESDRNFVAPGDREHPQDHSVAWAFTYLQASADVDAVLWFGNHDGIRVALDGAVVFDHHFHVPDNWDSHAVPVRLAAGTHRLMLQVENWTGRTGFWLRVARPDGGALAEVRPTLRPDASDLADSARAQPGCFTDDELLRLLPRSRTPELTFDTPDQVDRLAIEGDGGAYPCWRRDPGPADSRPPNPGASGFLGMHAETNDFPMRAYWKVRVPDKPSRVRVRASTVPAAGPGRADCLLRVRVFDGAWKSVLSEVVGPDARPDAANWRWFEGDLAGFEGKDVLVEIDACVGGRENYYEDLWIDAVEIRSAN